MLYCTRIEITCQHTKGNNLNIRHKKQSFIVKKETLDEAMTVRVTAGNKKKLAKLAKRYGITPGELYRQVLDNFAEENG